MKPKEIEKRILNEFKDEDERKLIKEIIEYVKEKGKSKIAEALKKFSEDIRFIEEDEDENVIYIHPAQDFNKVAWFMVKLRKRGKEKIYLLTSERTLIPIDNLPENIKLLENVSNFPNVFLGKIKLPADTKTIIKFLKGEEEVIDFPTIFNKVKSKIMYYMDIRDEENNLDEATYSLLALWCIGTWLHQLFNSYPYLFINAPMRSGKTKLLQTLSLFSFNPQLVVNPSISSLFRLIQLIRPTILADEVEKWNKSTKSEFNSILLSGYKKGFEIPRVEEVMVKKLKKLAVSTFECYSPKAFANIIGIPEVLEDRCITIILRRTTDSEKANTDPLRDLNFNHSEFQKIRDEIFIWVLKNWERVKEAYERLNIEDEELENFRKIVSARSYEIWFPILTLAKFVDKKVYESIIELAIKLSLEKYEAELTQSIEATVIYALASEVRENGWYKVSELTNELKNYEGLEHLNSKSLIRILKRLKLIKGRRKYEGRIHILLRVKDIERMCRAYAIDYDLIKEGFEIVPKSKKDMLLFILNKMPDEFTLSEFKKKAKDIGLSEEELENKLIPKLIEEGYIFEKKPNIWAKVAKFAE